MQAHRSLCVAVALVLLGLPRAVFAQSVDDRYIAGYAAAVLEREFRLPDATLAVQDGQIIVYANDLSGADSDKIKVVLQRIKGVRPDGVKLLEKVAPRLGRNAARRQHRHRGAQ